MTPAPPIPDELAFILTGQPKPRGLWCSSIGRDLCRLLGHDPRAHAAQMSDSLPRALLLTWAWACPRCGLRFAYCHAQGLDDDPARAHAAHLANTHALYLDLLHDANQRRASLLLPPLRAIPQIQSRQVHIARD